MATENTTTTSIDPKELNDLFEINEDKPVETPVDTTKLNFSRTRVDENDLNLSGIKPDKPIENPVVDPIVKTPPAEEVDISDLVASDNDSHLDKPEKDLDLAALEDLVKEEKFFLFDDGKEL